MTPRPKINQYHESSTKGMYIIGDLVNAPAIKLAFWQGYQLGKHLLETLEPSSQTDVYDVCVVGAGPAGIGVALALQGSTLRFLILEKERPFFSIEKFPVGKWIYAEPTDMELPKEFWFKDAPKEELIQRWTKILEEASFPIRFPFNVDSIEKKDTLFQISNQKTTLSSQRVILAIGKRSSPRKLGISGEDSPLVQYHLQDPADHVGKKILVIGGGDSAVEAALALSAVSESVTLCYRGSEIIRPSIKNKERLNRAISENKLSIRLNANPTRIDDRTVSFLEEAEEFDVIFIHIGSEISKTLASKFNIRLEDQTSKKYGLFLLAFALFTYAFYIIKSGLKTVSTDTQELLLAKRQLFPFDLGSYFSELPSLLQVDLGFRTVDGSFWGTLIYSMLITGFGCRAILKYKSKVQTKRYLSLIFFQLIFLFGIPELIAPLLISISEHGFWYQFFGGDRAWKFYALSVPWPLNIWGLIDAPSWTQTGSSSVVYSWLTASALVSFVAIPLYVRKNGLKFCSYMCGCGGLAETLGDLFRELAPRGPLAKKLEASGRWIFLLAIPVTLLILFDAWNLLSLGVLKDAKVFAEHWYTLMVDFWLASVIGVAFYPILGNRIWCRYFCPLRAYMEVLSRRFSKIAIKSTNACIQCGECTRYCQMGIQVEKFASRQELLHNDNSSCIQCGICIEVCPINVLSIGERDEPVQLNWDVMMNPPKASWE